MGWSTHMRPKVLAQLLCQCASKHSMDALRHTISTSCQHKENDKNNIDCLLWCQIFALSCTKADNINITLLVNMISNYHRFNPTECDSCTVEQCNCDVQCQPGHLPAGNGILGPRSCSIDDPVLADAPICYPNTALKAVCRKTDIPDYNEKYESSGQQCDNCETDQPCDCKFSCGIFERRQLAFRNIGKYDGNEPRCTFVPTDLKEARCSDVKDPELCMLHQSGGKPCCWTNSGCRDQISEISAVNFRSEKPYYPEKCAPTMKVGNTLLRIMWSM